MDEKPDDDAEGEEENRVVAHGSPHLVSTGGYVDPYGFTPLTPSLSSTVSQILEGTGGRRGFSYGDDAVPEVNELERLGYVEDVRNEFGGGHTARLTDRGMRYPEEERAYLERFSEWEKAERRGRVGSFARDVALLLIGAAATMLAERAPAIIRALRSLIG